MSHTLPRQFIDETPRMRETEEADWREEARCAETDPELFSPTKGGSTSEAKSVCARCPVRAQCLQYAIDNEERFGIWGGLSVNERDALRKGKPKKDTAPVDRSAVTPEEHELRKKRVRLATSGGETYTVASLAKQLDISRPYITRLLGELASEKTTKKAQVSA